MPIIHNKQLLVCIEYSELGHIETDQRFAAVFASSWDMCPTTMMRENSKMSKRLVHRQNGK